MKLLKLFAIVAFGTLLLSMPGKTSAQEIAQTAPTPSALCSDPAAVANYWNVPYPAQNSAALNNLINCIRTNVPSGMIDNGQIYTFQLNPPLINYTRGNRDCGLDVLCASLDCHAAYSCHYGGRTGTNGAEAVDFNALAPYTEAQLFSSIRTLVYPGGACFGMAKYVLLEGDHTHLSTNQNVGCDTSNIPTTAPAPTEGTTESPEAVATTSFSPSALFNPISCGSPICIITKILRIALGLTSLIALVMFIFGGFTILTSGGNAERIERGKKTLVYAAIGIVVILLSWSLVYVVSTTFIK